jgi:hypothetical protein
VQTHCALFATSVLPLQRLHADKAAQVVVTAATLHQTFEPRSLVVGSQALDMEPGILLPAWAVTLPTPYVDVDPTFVSLR